MEIAEKEYNELRRNQEKLFCLISHGVQDWDEYDSAMKDYNEWFEKDKQKEKINSIVDTYKDKIMGIFQPILSKMDAILNEDGIKEVKDILKRMCIETLNVTSKNNYETWANDLMDVIEEIAQEKYPDVPYWLDTGNRYQCCIEMLAHFRKDL